MAKDDEIIVPKRSKPLAAGRASGGGSGASAPMRKLIRITCGIGIVLGGFVTLIGMMAIIGIVTDNVWVRLLGGLVVVIGLPAILADRLLKRTSANLATRGSLGMVADLFAIVLLGGALVFVAANTATKGLLTSEGDRYARSGSTTMARVVYFLAGVSPAFPGESSTRPAGSASVSASNSGAAPLKAPEAPSSR